MIRLPEAFIQRMRGQLGEEADAFFESLSGPPSTSIRLHPHKGYMSFTDVEKIPWCVDGYYLASRPSFHLDPHWHGGAYYVQEASSMIIDHIIPIFLSEKRPRVWLDMCAAPGGKTGILAKHMGPADVLIANEVVPQRRSILRENLVKGGFINTFITGLQSTAFDEPLADIILIDAPCAGEGMMRKDPEAIRQWNPGLVNDCSLIQQRIVGDVVKSLNEDGYLIYSTCSYSHQENIDNVVRFSNEFSLAPIEVSFPRQWNITPVISNGVTGYQLYPHKVKGEGLFVAILQNTADAGKPKRSRSNNYFIETPSWLQEHLHTSKNFELLKSSLDNQFISVEARELGNRVMDRFPKAELISSAGELKGKDFIPSHFLAMSNVLREGFPQIALDNSQALDYLERNTQTLPDVETNGWYLITYETTILGWAKKTLQGWKNHYPLNWRLRSRKNT